MTLTTALDELIVYNELIDWCDAYITYQALENLAVAISGDLSQP
jgi:hypothetical protein